MNTLAESSRLYSPAIARLTPFTIVDTLDLRALAGLSEERRKEPPRASDDVTCLHPVSPASLCIAPLALSTIVVARTPMLEAAGGFPAMSVDPASVTT